MVRIKICGITNYEDALLAVSLGAEELGFNFFRRSPRYIEPMDAARIISRLPATASIVGVFVDESPENIARTAKDAGLHTTQLHGDEPPTVVAVIGRLTGLPVIKALRVTPDFQIDDATEAAKHCSAILLDSYSANEPGGTGRTFDWEVARDLGMRVKGLYLAGGLGPENVGDAIRSVRPSAVDTCSRIESAPGRKDPAKLKQFIREVRSAV